MMSFISALFLAAVVWFIIQILRILISARRQTRNFFSQFSSGTSTNGQQHTGKQYGWSNPRSAKSKKIDRTMGEYVDFEEITSTTSNNADNNTRRQQQSSSSDHKRAESQISDAEWEDI